MLMLSSRMAGTSEKSRNSPFILTMCAPPLSKAHGGTEEKKWMTAQKAKPQILTDLRSQWRFFESEK